MSTSAPVRTDTKQDRKVRDMSLAEWGRKEISIAEKEMPGLISIREKYAPSKPLAGVRITGSLHMTIQTAVLIETLQELGADVRWASCNIFSTQDHAAAAIAKTGTPVFAWKGETLEEYWALTLKAVTFPGGKGPQLVVDDGGDVTLLIHKGCELEEGSDWVDSASSSHEEQVIKDLLKRVYKEDPLKWTTLAKQWRGVSEETTTGTKAISTLEHMRARKDQAIDCNIRHFDNEIQVDRLNKSDAKRLNIKPQYDMYTFPKGNSIYLLAEGRLVNLGCATGHPSFVMSNSFSNQVLAQLDLWKNKDVYKVGVYVLPKKLDEEVARLHLEKIGVKLTKLTENQADYLGISVDGPFKSEHYRY